MYILHKKNGQKRSILCEIRTQSFYYPLYGVATAYLTNENPSTDKSSRAINNRSPKAYKAQKKGIRWPFQSNSICTIRNVITNPYVKAYNFLPNVQKEGGVWFNGFLNNVRKKNAELVIWGIPKPN